MIARWLLPFLVGCAPADAGSLAVIGAGGGGGGGAATPSNLWSGRTDRALGADDDFFEDSDASGYFDYDVDSQMALSEGANGLELTVSAGGGVLIMGASKPITAAASSYTVTTHVTWGGSTWEANNAGPFLCVSEDVSAAPTTASHSCMGYQNSIPGAKYIQQSWTDYNSSGATQDVATYFGDVTGWWLRLCVLNGSTDTIRGLASSNGQTWSTGGTASVTFASAGVNPPVDVTLAAFTNNVAGVFRYDALVIKTITETPGDCYHSTGGYDD